MQSWFQSASRFAVVSDPTPWHAVLTSPVVVVLHTTPPYPLRVADRICPQWGKTPSQVPYISEAVFGRSPAPLPEGVSKMPGRGELGVFVGFYLGGVGVWGGRSGVGFAGRLPEWFRHSRSLALTSWLNQLQKLSPRAVSTSFEEPSSRAGPVCFKRDGFDTGRSFVAARLNQLQKVSVAARLNQLKKASVAARFNQEVYSRPSSNVL